jgi:hypothetical protein
MYGQAGTVGLDSYEITAKNSAAVTLEQGDLVYVDPSQSDWAVVDGENIGCLSVELAVESSLADNAPLVGVVTTTGPVAIGDWLKVKLVGIVNAKANTSVTSGSAFVVGDELSFSDKTGCLEKAVTGEPVVAYALEAVAQDTVAVDRTTAPKIQVVMFAPGIHCDMQ